jgi:hypothetical protein
MLPYGIALWTHEATFEEALEKANQYSYLTHNRYRVYKDQLSADEWYDPDEPWFAYPALKDK